MECLFLIIVFIIIIASEYLPDKWLLVATIGTFLIVMSIIRQIIKIKKRRFNFKDLILLFLKFLNIVALYCLIFYFKIRDGLL